jgi:predicted Zn-dependent peptidase
MGRNYGPSSMVVAGAGALDHDTLLDLVGKHFADLPKVDIATPEAARYAGGEFREERELDQVHIVLGFPSAPYRDPMHWPTQVLGTLLGGGMSSRLFQEIRENRGLAYSVSAFATGYQDVGTFAVYAGTTVEHLPELTGALNDVFAKSSLGITDAELLRAKNQLKSGVVMSRESSGAVAEWIARHLLVYGRYKTADEILAKIDAVTMADVARAGAAALCAAKPTVAALGPVGSVNKAQLSAKLAMAA